MIGSFLLHKYDTNAVSKNAKTQHQTVLQLFICACAFLVVCFATFIMPMHAYAGNTELQPGQIRVYQDFRPVPEGVLSSFYDLTYKLVPETPDAPMPAGTHDGEYDWTMRGSCESVVTVLEGTSVPTGVYTYKMVPYGPAPENYTREMHTYTVKLYVNAAGEVDTRIFDESGMKVGDPGWLINLESDPIDPPDPADTTDPDEPDDDVDPQDPADPADPSDPADPPTTHDTDGVAYADPVATTASHVQQAAQSVLPSSHGMPKTADVIIPLVALIVIGIAALCVARMSRVHAREQATSQHFRDKNHKGEQL